MTANQNYQMGWIQYLNLLPLRCELQKLISDDSFIREGHPKQVNEWLAGGEIQIAPSSSINLIDNPHLTMAFPVGVASEGPVQSVYLGLRASSTRVPEQRVLNFILDRQEQLSSSVRSTLSMFKNRDIDCARAASQIMSLACTKSSEVDFLFPKVQYTAASAASVQLTKIMMFLWFGQQFNNTSKVDHLPNDAQKPVSLELLIGDEALKRRPEFSHIIDLGEVWFQLTGLPFVFAVWQTSLKNIPPSLHKTILSAAHQSQISMKSKPEMYSAQISNQPIDTLGNKIDLSSYWGSIQYELTPRHMLGLNLFFELAREVRKLDRL